MKKSNDHQEINPKYKPDKKHEKLFKKNGEIPQYVPQKQFENNKLIKKDRFEINKKPQISENYHRLSIPKNNSIKQHININVSDIMNFRQIFSSSFRYYRLGTPSMDELSHFEVLEGFIEQNMKFVDKNNPTTHIGTYTTSEDIFKGQKYEIFMMAGSVLQRQKSRSGSLNLAQRYYARTTWGLLFFEQHCFHHFILSRQFKKGMIQSYSNKFGGKKKHYKDINIPLAYKQSQFSIERGIGYLKICNPSQKEFISKFSLAESEGLKIIQPNTLSNQYLMKPHSEHILGFWVSTKGYSEKIVEQVRCKSDC